MLDLCSCLYDMVGWMGTVVVLVFDLVFDLVSRRERNNKHTLALCFARSLRHVMMAWRRERADGPSKPGHAYSALGARCSPQ